jgi:very-long-chain enoyl-CoA reductase
MMKVQIRNTHNQPITELELSINATVDELQEQFHKSFPRFYPARQRFAIQIKGKDKKEVLQKGKPLAEYGITAKDTPSVVEFKDLGTQVSWKTVYLAEYIGPFLLYLFFYMQPSFIYGEGATTSFYQRIACYCFLFHFGRRLFESAFVHIWSSESLGLYFLYKNCAYYWSAGATIAYFTNKPDWEPIFNDTIVQIAVVVYVLSQFANMWIHLQLRLVRPSTDPTYRWFPEGFLWTITRVSFPNYFFEVIIWIAWNVAFFSIPGVLFLIAGTGQMAVWAAKKHSNYRKTFDGKDGRRQYPRSRRAMIPFLF